MPKPIEETPRSDLNDVLHDIVDRMLAPFGKTSQPSPPSLLGANYPIDITKPNQHDSKGAFLSELSVVEKAIEHAEGFLGLFLDFGSEQAPATNLDRFEEAIDATMQSASSLVPITSTSELIRRNIAETGGLNGSLWIMVDIRHAMKMRLEELKEQHDQFWNVPHRAPDYYARAIASRLAKLFARETGKRPTSGSSPVSGGASTGFTRALEDIFELLDIESGTRTPAEWAIKNLTEDDFKPALITFAATSNLGFPMKTGRPTLSSILETED